MVQHTLYISDIKYEENPLELHQTVKEDREESPLYPSIFPLWPLYTSVAHCFSSTR